MRQFVGGCCEIGTVEDAVELDALFRVWGRVSYPGLLSSGLPVVMAGKKLVLIWVPSHDVTNVV